MERAIRDAYTKYLLMDSKPRRVLLALPSAFPYALLSTLLTLFFSNFQCPSITALTIPVLTAVAAGLRSALVIDIGWSETIVTGIFEYREVSCSRSVRAGKALTIELAQLLSHQVRKARGQRSHGEPSHDDEDFRDEVSFEECEQVLARLGWCRSRDQASARDKQSSPSRDPVMTIPLQSTRSPITIRVPFSTLADPIEHTLFHPPISADGDPDDHEVPIHQLAYRALLNLSPDLRSICMARVVVTGGATQVPGLKKRIIDEIAGLVRERGWDPVRGKANERRKEKEAASKRVRSQVELSETRKTREFTDHSTQPNSAIASAFVEPGPDEVLEKIRRHEGKGGSADIRGQVRGVETLGAWAGASLVGGLKIKGVVEVEREKFLSQGLAGASKEGEVSVVPQRQSLGPTGPRPGAGDRSHWTLGVWA
ncbi:MAG: hypothetical protein M1838_003743 [Thelocarpon superellum]|nr:MAG: hypothetical protein M1838_003743 [Thelocarpon superellum]